MSLGPLVPQHSHPDTEGLTCQGGRLTGAVAGDPMNWRSGLGSQQAEATQWAGAWAPGEAEAQGPAGGVIAIEEGDGDIPVGERRQ